MPEPLRRNLQEKFLSLGRMLAGANRTGVLASFDRCFAAFHEEFGGYIADASVKLKDEEVEGMVEDIHRVEAGDEELQPAPTPEELAMSFQELEEFDLYLKAEAAKKEKK